MPVRRPCGGGAHCQPVAAKPPVSSVDVRGHRDRFPAGRERERFCACRAPAWPSIAATRCRMPGLPAGTPVGKVAWAKIFGPLRSSLGLSAGPRAQARLPNAAVRTSVPTTPPIASPVRSARYGNPFAQQLAGQESGPSVGPVMITRSRRCPSGRSSCTLRARGALDGAGGAVPGCRGRSPVGGPGIRDTAHWVRQGRPLDRSGSAQLTCPTAGKAARKPCHARTVSGSRRAARTYAAPLLSIVRAPPSPSS